MSIVVTLLKEEVVEIMGLVQIFVGIWYRDIQLVVEVIQIVSITTPLRVALQP